MRALLYCALVLHWALGTSAPAFAAQDNAGRASGWDITGTWTFEVDTGAGSGSPTFTFKQEGEQLSGTYKGLFGTAELAGTVKSRDVKFTFKAEFQGQNFEVVYEGKIEDKDTMQGTVKLGDVAEGTWTGKRQQ